MRNRSWVDIVRIRRSLLVLFLSSGAVLATSMQVATATEPKRAVFAEYPIAASDVGWNAEQRHTVRRVVTVALLGTPAAAEGWAEKCLRSATREVALHIRKDIELAADDSMWRPPVTVLADLAHEADVDGLPITHQSYLDARRTRAAEVQRGIMQYANNTLAKAFETCGAPRASSRSKVVLFLRQCPDKTQVCRDLVAGAKDSGSDMSEAMFDVVAAMLLNYSTVTLNAPVGLGEFSANPLPAPVAPLALPAPAILDGVVEREMHQKAPTVETALAQFEAMVERRRLQARGKSGATASQLAMTTPALLGLSKQQLLQIQDVVSHGLFAVSYLPDKTTLPFKHLSDEVARSRLLECTRLRALTDVKEIAACAGYDVDNSLLQACLAGEQCRPAMTDSAYAAMLDITLQVDIADIAAGGTKPLRALLEEARLPRVMLPRELDALRSSAKECRASGHASPEAVATCVALSTLPDDQRAAIECLSEPTRLGRTDASVTDCLGDAVPPEVLAKVACYTNPEITLRAFAECSGMDSATLAWTDAAACAAAAPSEATAAACFSAPLNGALGTDAAKYAACIQAQEPTGACLRDALLSNVGVSDQTKALLTCFENHDATNRAETEACALAAVAGDTEAGRFITGTVTCLQGRNEGGSRMQAATCLAGTIVAGVGDATTRALVGCASQGASVAGAQCVSSVLAQQVDDPFTKCLVQGGASILAAQTCALAKELDGKGVADRAALCVLNNGGPSAPAAACALGIDMGRREVAVAIQCASYSPDASSFAACAAGQLLVLEASQCLKDNFGEGNCFGPNNEFQKALRTVGIDLSGGTLPAKFIDAQFEFYRQQIYFGSKVAKEVGRLGKDVARMGQEVADVAAKVGREVERVAKKAERAIRDLGKSVKRCFGLC